MAASASGLRRWCAVVVLVAAVAACGDDDTDAVTATEDETTSSFSVPEASTTQVPETEVPDTDGAEPVAPAALEFRPVLQLLPPGGVPDEASGAGCTTPDEGWVADQPVLAPQVENGEEVACYQLGPVVVDGGAVESAAAAEGGAGLWMVALVLTTDGIAGFNETVGECFTGGPICPTRQLAIVVDRTVLSAPSINAPEFERDAISISGDFTRADAEAIAARLG